MGVSRKPSGSFEARYRRNGKTIHVGTFPTEVQARAALKLDRQTYDNTMNQDQSRYQHIHVNAQAEPTLWKRIKSIFGR